MDARRHCPLCASLAPHVLEAFGRELFRCPLCGLLFVDPLRFPSDEECLARYRTHNNEPSEGYRRFLAPAREAVARLAPRGSRVLDLGCGPSPVLAGDLAELGYDAQAHDPLFFPAEPQGLFRAVVATEVFEHFRSPASDAARAIAFLDVPAVLVVMTLLVTPEIDLTRWWYLRDFTHVVFWSRATFEWLASRHGLQLAECDGSRLVVLRRLRGRPTFLRMFS